MNGAITLTLIQRDPAIHDTGANARPPDLLVDVRILTPNFRTSTIVHRIHHAQSVEDSVVNQRRSFIAVLRIPLRPRDLVA